MNKTLTTLMMVMAGAFVANSAQAACGGGGYILSGPSTNQTRTSSAKVETDSKVAELRRDVEKAQRKLDQCVGSCDRERSKLEEAERKLAKRIAENASR